MPNKAHAGVARLAREGFYRDVITTNWDILIEAACRQYGCSHVSIKRVDDLGQARDVCLVAWKMHGCQTDPSSIVASTSQLDAGHPEYSWAKPQVEAAFQGLTIVFLGYSGSLEKVSQTMADVSRWSQQAGIKRYVVNHGPWEGFTEHASEFVAASGVTENEYFSADVLEFVSDLVDRLVRMLVLKIASEYGPSEHLDLMGLLVDEHHGRRASREAYIAPDSLIDDVAGADSIDGLLSNILISPDRYPAVREHGQVLGRFLAWVSILLHAGWAPVAGLPALEKKGERVYLVAGRVSGAARVLKQKVEDQVRSNPSFRYRLAGGDPVANVACLLLLASGDLGQAAAHDIVNDSAAEDLIFGARPGIRYYTEQHFLEEVTAA